MPSFPHLPVTDHLDNTRNWEVLQTQLRGQMFEPGDLKPTGRSKAPEGWLLCEGQEVSRTTYSKLFEAIGTTFGEGDKTLTFNVPDGKDRTLIGAGSHALGSKGGEATVKLTTAQLAAHTHEINALSTQFVVNKAAEQGVWQNTGLKEATTSTGGGEAHENMPPYFTGNWLIKT